jgi:hypothetical protein
MGDLLNKYNFPITHAHEEFSIDVPRPNMLMSTSLSSSLGPSTLHWTIKFNQ